MLDNHRKHEGDDQLNLFADEEREERIRTRTFWFCVLFLIGIAVALFSTVPS